MSLQEDAKRILPFMQAIAEGRQCEYPLFGGFKTVAGITELISMSGVRIKLERKWRPYTREEWERVVRVRYKANGHSVPVGQIGNEIVWLGSSPYTFEEAFFKYTHLDGTPCGVEVEE